MGAGAIGCYVGATLARGGRKVRLIGRARHVEAIEKDGLIFESSGRRERIAITATQDIAGVHDAQLVLFCVKSPDTEDVAQKMAASLVP